MTRFRQLDGALADGAASLTEAKLEALWKALLKKDQIGPSDDFFLIGGDSLMATQLVLSVNDLFQVELGLQAVFSEASTLRTMAAEIERLKSEVRTGRSPDLPLLTIDNRVPRHRGNNRTDKKRSDKKSKASDAELSDLFVLDKGTGLRLMRPGARSGSVVANSYGYRSPEIGLQKSAGTIRFAFLGDSMTFGSWSGGNDTTWPFHAIETLRRAHGGLPCDYINAAMPGNGVTHVGVQFRESISQFQPDVVALAPGTGASSADWARRKIGYSGVHHVVSRLGRWSSLLGLIEKNLVVHLRQLRALSNRGKLTFEPHELRELSKDFQSELHDLVNEIHNSGSVVVLLTRESKIRRDRRRLHQIWSAGSRLYFQPYMSISALLDVKDEFNRVCREIASQSGAVLVDMAEVLPATREYFEDSSHCTPAANRIIGERFGRALSNSGQFQQLLSDRSECPAMHTR